MLAERVPHKILVVDDVEATVQGLVEVLQEAGYEAAGVRTLAEGKTALVENAPDLLIVDVRLGAFNGLQLVATNPREIPVIVITGYPDSTLEAEARRFGAEFLLKPIDCGELLRLVSRKLAESGAGARIAGIERRRWSRRTVATPLLAQLDSGPARVVDVSYGGLCLEIPRPPTAALPPSFDVTFPGAALSVDVALVWHKPVDEARWMCGGIVRGDQAEWRRFIDAVS